MAEYSWTFNIGKIRVGWMKDYYGFTLQREPGLYLSLGKLDFYILWKK